MRSGTMPSSMLGTFQYILKNDGFLGLYAGLSASLLRQITYSTTRFGIYEEVKARLTKRNNGKQPSFPVLVAISSASGFIGGISGNAADITNVRMQGDAMLPPDQRRNYKHAIDGMLRMAREEGLMSWFRGVLPNSTRAAVMTASQLASYDTFKKMLLWYTPMTDNLATHFTASFLAGVTAATATAPVDVIKTRVMSASGKSISIGTLLRELFAKEGAAWMFKGWVPSFLRLGPWVPHSLPLKASQFFTNVTSTDKQYVHSSSWRCIGKHIESSRAWMSPSRGLLGIGLNNSTKSAFGKREHHIDSITWRSH